MAETENKKQMEDDILKFMQAKHKSAQEKYNAIQAIAKKYNVPLEIMLKNIITGWMLEEKEKKFSSLGKNTKAKNGKIL